MSLFVFDDAVARAWQPFALTRPVGELLCGHRTLRERLEQWSGRRCVGHLAGPLMEGFQEAGTPPALSGELPLVASGELVLILLSRWLPQGTVKLPEEPVTLRSGQHTIGWMIEAGKDMPSDDALLDPNSFGTEGGETDLGGLLLGKPWDLFAAGMDYLTGEILSAETSLPSGVSSIGAFPVVVSEGATLEPGVVLDARTGPILLEEGARVHAHTRLEGPLWVGKETHLLGGSISRSVIGPVCKIHGEVADSVVLGFTNKAHSGYLGHSYVGRWVNLGALTTNSDLKNDYGEIRVQGKAKVEGSGLLKLGTLIGDHAKTGIGTLLDTGSMVGAGSNLFGGGLFPKYVHPFSWGRREELVIYRLDKFLQVAEAAMSRRNVEFTDVEKERLGRIWSSVYTPTAGQPPDAG